MAIWRTEVVYRGRRFNVSLHPDWDGGWNLVTEPDAPGSKADPAKKRFLGRVENGRPFRRRDAQGALREIEEAILVLRARCNGWHKEVI